MTTVRLNIVFSGIDLDDDDVFDTMGTLSNVYWRSQGPLAFATAIVDSDSALAATALVVGQVQELVPSALPIRLDEDLVAIPDIASRVGVSREAVRNWANGTRQSNFPIPKGIVGDGIKVWAWSSVSKWLNANLNLGDQEEFPTELDTAELNYKFSCPQIHSI
ncbi:MAG: hypothetical protein ACC652_11130 [Acidimicrobiales bacterium]